MLFLVSKLNLISLHDHNCLFACRNTRRILQFYLHRVKNILTYIGLHVSSSVAHFIWKIKQFEFHILFTVGDIDWSRPRLLRNISHTWKRRVSLCSWGLNNQYVKKSENKCNLRATKSFDIAKINCGRAPCLSSSGGYQRGRSLLNCHVVYNGTFCWITQVRNISHPWDFSKSFIYSFCRFKTQFSDFIFIHRRFCYFTCVTCKLNNTLTEFRFPRAAANSRRSIFF